MDSLHTENTGAFLLDYLAVIRFSGEKAREFLQGQVTCDVRQLKPGLALRGAQCNLKGRILTLFYLVQTDDLYMVLPKDLAEQTLTSLKQIAMLSRVKVEVAEAYQVIAFYHPNQPALANAHTLDTHFSLQLVEKEAMPTIPLQRALAWHTLQLLHKHPEIYPETSGEFLPHRLDLHLNGYIHFDKGCYKGQEIIARTHYKATLKHTLILFKTSQPVHCLQKIFQADKVSELGEIVDFSVIEDEVYLVAATILKEKADTGYLADSLELIDLKLG